VLAALEKELEFSLTLEELLKSTFARERLLRPKPLCLTFFELFFSILLLLFLIRIEIPFYFFSSSGFSKLNSSLFKNSRCVSNTKVQIEKNKSFIQEA